MLLLPDDPSVELLSELGESVRPVEIIEEGFGAVLSAMKQLGGGGRGSVEGEGEGEVGEEGGRERVEGGEERRKSESFHLWCVNIF